MQLGTKLRTGKYGSENVVTGAAVGRSPAFFSSGPNGAGGQTLDTSLQPGTGSTTSTAFVQKALYSRLSGLHRLRAVRGKTGSPQASTANCETNS
ncbi:hypothetical protein AQ805_07495 [Burkholderia pseudomallei]|nr:hypothetical protein AQ805_07495 [Burkholderia pseudomallei]